MSEREHAPVRLIFAGLMLVLLIAALDNTIVALYGKLGDLYGRSGSASRRLGEPSPLVAPASRSLERS